MAESSDVSNVTVYQEGSNILIEYDLAKDNVITPYVSIDGGEYVKLTNVSGDVGARVAAGHKKVVWDVLSQYERFEFTDVKFKMESVRTTVTDICGNDYPVVKIGEQYWMAENMRCNKYDTESEAYASNRYKLSTSRYAQLDPYYTNASDKSLWNADSRRFGKNLSSEQISKLGYLYNWSAAVGVMDGRAIKGSPNKIYQGICPNGWHIPLLEDWHALLDISKKNIAGLHFKSKSGWYADGNGLDSYNLQILPSGCAEGSVVEMIGTDARFWTPFLESDYEAVNIYFFYNSDAGDYNEFELYSARSVRCIKNQD